jgi:hypothetical protein
VRKRIFGGLKAYLRPPRTIPVAILLVEIMENTFKNQFQMSKNSKNKFSM